MIHWAIPFGPASQLGRGKEAKAMSHERPSAIRCLAGSGASNR